MPLPAGDMQWPPIELAQITPTLNTWSAWYSGDPDQLVRAYNGGGTATVRPSQRAGGVVGAVARWFWGQPTPVNEKRAKLHIPIASDLAMASADLLFAEPPVLLTGDKPDTAKVDALTELLEENAWESMLIEAAEVVAGLGGGFLRVTWDTAVSDHVIFTAVDADAAWPEFRFGRLHSVTFWRIVSRQDAIVVRHLERHEKGRIEHGLFQGSETRLGTRIPLTEHSSTKELAVDETSAVTTGSERLTAVYVPNMRPNRLWRNDPTGKNLGRSDFAGLEGEMDGLDETFSSWMRDIRLAKGRIIAAAHMLETNGRGQGAMLDVDREVFVGLNIAPNESDNSTPITVQQFEVQSEKYMSAIQALLERIVSSAGYSLQTFGLDGDGAAATATEIAARQRKTMTTREKKTRYWSVALAAFLQAALEVEAHVFDGKGPLESLKLEFPPSVQPTQTELAQTAQSLKAAQAASTKTLVQMVHPDWDDTKVAEEARLIIAESTFTVPDIGPLPGDADEAVDDGSPTVDDQQ